MKKCELQNKNESKKEFVSLMTQRLLNEYFVREGLTISEVAQILNVKEDWVRAAVVSRYGKDFKKIIAMHKAAIVLQTA